MSTHTAASANLADVQVKVNIAARGDTVIIPAGSATWTGTLTLTRGVTLQGAGRDSLTISVTNTAISIGPDATAITNEEAIKITGITFDGPAPTSMFWVQGAGGQGSKPWRSLIVGDCRFKNNNTTVFYTRGQTRGVIYGSIFDRCNILLRPFGNNDNDGSHTGWQAKSEWRNPAYNPTPFGTADQLFFEDNKIIFSSTTNWSCSGWIESGQGGRVVVRYNEYDLINSNCTELWDVHGFQNFVAGPNNGQTGTMQVEYYKNIAKNFAGFRLITFRGGRGVIWGNTITGSGGSVMHINQYDEVAEGGSGCDNITQITGGQVNKAYFWENTRNGAPLNAIIGSLGVGCGCTEGSAWFNAKLQGYVPYTYPHPLRSGAPIPPEPPVVVEPPLISGLSFQAEAGAVDAPYTVAGGLVSQSVVTTDPAAGGRIRWKVTIPTAGEYTVKAKVKAENNGADSLFMEFDREPTTAEQWTITPLTSGVEERTNPKAWNLTAGVHTLYVRGRESDCALDSITIVAPEAPPEPPIPPAELTIADIKGLQEALDAKADKGHQHIVPEVQTK